MNIKMEIELLKRSKKFYKLNGSHNSYWSNFKMKRERKGIIEEKTKWERV